MNLVLFGPPGAGKGTQAYILVKDLKLFKISTGDLLREEITKKSSLGVEIKLMIDKGLLVSDSIINNLIENILSNNNYSNRLIFDGYPRNRDQAKNLDILLKKYKKKISCVINLKIKNDTIIKRILGRQICSKCDRIFNKFFDLFDKKKCDCGSKYLKTRSDDNEVTARNRIEIYIKQTLPVIKYYQEQNLVHEVDGMNDINQICKEIREIIDRLET